MMKYVDMDGPEGKEAWVSVLEDVLLEADDDEILDSPEMNVLAQLARSVAQRAVDNFRDLRPAPLRSAMRRRPRRATSRSVTRRVMVRELLVAHPRARDLVGKKTIDALSEEELEKMITRLTQLGLLPDGQD